MGVSQKYRTFTQLMEDVSIDFSTYALEGMIEPQQLIKVATRVNYDLGLNVEQGDLCIFNPHTAHCNNPLKGTGRMSFVFYFVVQQVNGKSHHSYSLIPSNLSDLD